MNQLLKYALAGTAAFVTGAAIVIVAMGGKAAAAPVTPPVVPPVVPTIKQGQGYQIQVADATGATDSNAILLAMSSVGWTPSLVTGPSLIPTAAGTAGSWNVTAVWGGADLAFNNLGTGFIPPSLALLTITGPGLQ